MNLLALPEFADNPVWMQNEALDRLDPGFAGILVTPRHRVHAAGVDAPRQRPREWRKRLR
jgi:hypothetical protein